MPVFRYKALGQDGSVAEGQLEAGGRQDAFRQMEGRGLKPISLAEYRNGKTASPQVKKDTDANLEGGWSLSLGGARKISARVLETFTRLLSTGWSV